MATCLELSNALTQQQNAIVAQQGVVRAKHAFSVAQMTLWQAAQMEESAAQNALNIMTESAMNLQMQMLMQNCPFQPGQA